MTEAKKETVVHLLPEGRLINASLFEKDAYTPERGKPGTPQYKVEIAFDPAQVTGEGTIEDALANVCGDKWGDAAFNDFFDGKIRSPLLSGDEMAAKRADKGKSGDAYKGKLVVRAGTIFNYQGQDAPGGIQVFGPDVKPITIANAQAVYPGCFGQAAVVIVADTDADGKKYVKFYLNAFQKTKDGEPLVASKDHSVLFKPAAASAGADGGAGAAASRRRK